MTPLVFGFKKINFLVKTVLITAYLFFSPIIYATKTTTQNSIIILQGFNWESYANKSGWYNAVNSVTPEISEAGFNYIWLPPPNLAYDGEGIYPHSRGYIPLEYYNLNTPYGTHIELKTLIDNLKSKKIYALADVVINHRGKHAGTPENPIFKNPSWGLWAFTGGDGLIGQGAQDTGEATDYAYDLDLTNQHILGYLKDWMKWLITDVGFAGFRYDFAKGFSGRFIGEINQFTKPLYSIGEYWTDMDWSCSGKKICYNQNAHRNSIISWINSIWPNYVDISKAPDAFDFTTKGILQTAIKESEFWRLMDQQQKAPGLIGIMPEKAITFIDNHDTGSTQNHWPFGDKNQIMQGYAYILTHPGTPCVFWDHFFDWGLKWDIKKLTLLRKQQGIRSTSSLYIKEASYGLYAAFIDDKIAIKIGPRSWHPDLNIWQLYHSGNDWAVWIKK